MALFARALRELGEHVRDEHGGSFLALARCGDGSAVALAERLGELADLARRVALRRRRGAVLQARADRRRRPRTCRASRRPPTTSR